MLANLNEYVDNFSIVSTIMQIKIIYPTIVLEYFFVIVISIKDGSSLN